MQLWAFTVLLTVRDECDFTSWELLMDSWVRVAYGAVSVCSEVACKPFVPGMLLLCVDGPGMI